MFMITKCKGTDFIWIVQALRVSLTIFLERQNLSHKGFGRVLENNSLNKSKAIDSDMSDGL